MVCSISSAIFGLLLLFKITAWALADTVLYDFDIGWVSANPDAAFDRPTIGINGQWPIPPITATVGDRVVVNVINHLGNQSTSLHFHGLYMNGTTVMDGTVGVSQCSIPPNGTFTYDFKVDQPGTYWYHSHDNGQYPDGLRGPLIVTDPESPYRGKYDDEIVMTMSDWYHDEMAVLLPRFLSLYNPTGAEPVPNAALLNDTQNLTVPVQPGKTYMFRMVNMGAFAGQYLWFEGHTMQVIEVDGIYTEAAETDMLYLAAAQRYSVLVTTKNDTSGNFAIVSSMDQDLFDTVPDTLNPNATGWLVYDSTKELPSPALLDEFDPFDDFTLLPLDGEKLLDEVDYSFNLDVQMNNLGDGKNYAFFNDITYVMPKTPTLYTVTSAGEASSNASIYGSSTNAFVLKKNDVIEIIVNNNDPGKHPFHLHGHYFQAVVRSDEDAGYYVGNETLPATPMKRDTFMLIYPLRVWLFHCHIEWHVYAGLVATMIEAPEEVQQSLTIPDNHLQVCRDVNQPTFGNAAGNTQDFFDLTGENLPYAPIPAGFTTRGIVALVFSCISAFLGIAVISWYGASEIGSKAPRAAIQDAVTGTPTAVSGSAPDHSATLKWRQRVRFHRQTTN